MQIKDLIPWTRNKQEVSPRDGHFDETPLLSLQRDINRVFDDFWHQFERPSLGWNGGLGNGAPRTDVSETDDDVDISIELPGLSEKDVEVNVTDDVLTIRGERKEEKEDKSRGYHVSERSYGSFHRMVPLPPGVDTDKAEANFKNGLLTVHFPKTPEAKAKVKRIEVRGN